MKKNYVKVAIETIMSEIEPAEIKKITKSMDNKFMAVIEEKGHYIEM